jgi:hypothetical protein
VRTGFRGSRVGNSESMTQFESLLWERHVRRSRPRHPGSSQPLVDPRCEFTGRPPGKLGRLLLSEVETYLAFFALAHEDSPQQ